MTADGGYLRSPGHENPVALAQRLIELSSGGRQVDLASVTFEELYNLLHNAIDRPDSLSSGHPAPTYFDFRDLAKNEGFEPTKQQQHFSSPEPKAVKPHELSTPSPLVAEGNLSDTVWSSQFSGNENVLDTALPSFEYLVPMADTKDMRLLSGSPSLTASTSNSVSVIAQRAPSIAVKLFVNRIPKWMTNEELRAIFAPFGEVTECNILKNARGPKGCAFVKYASIADAYQAILHLHGKRVLNKEAGPVQIKYADGEIDRLGLSADVQPGGESVKEILLELFSKFGRVDEVFVLRDQNGQSKRSAFVTFPKMSMALNAIKALDRKCILPSARRPLEVRLAQSKASKNRNNKNIHLPRGSEAARFPSDNEGHCQRLFETKAPHATAQLSLPSNNVFLWM